MRAVLCGVGVILVGAGTAVEQHAIDGHGSLWPGALLWPAGLLVVVAAIALYESNESALRAELRAFARGAGTVGPAPEPVAQLAISRRWLTQEDYAKILEHDRELLAQFEWTESAEPVDLAPLGSGAMSTPPPCKRCHRRAAFFSIAHPIWDGPFDGAGSGVVDVRRVPWCFFCADPLDGNRLGVEPIASRVHQLVEPGVDKTFHLPGLPIRLPWLDTLPVRLVPALFERPAFHRLMVAVERWRPPAASTEGTS